jgi:hypothetical protein
MAFIALDQMRCIPTLDDGGPVFLLALNLVVINTLLINIGYKRTRTIFSLDLELRAELPMPNSSQEVLSSFPSFFLGYYLFLQLLFSFIWREDLLRCKVLEDGIPDLHEYRTQLLLNILSEVLCQVNE